MPTKVARKKTLAKERKVVILKDDRDYDSKGRVIRYATSDREKEVEIVEPFDPAYLQGGEDEDSNPCVLENGEVRFITKVGILERALKVARIKFHWNGGSFVISKMKKEFEFCRYIWVDRNDYTFCYGGEDGCTLESTKVRDVIAKAQNFLK